MFPPQIAGYRFDALVFPEHAEYPEYELGESRISQFWLKRIADGQTVVNWDRGMDQPATTALAAAYGHFLAAGLADHTYPN